MNRRAVLAACAVLIAGCSSGTPQLSAPNTGLKPAAAVAAAAANAKAIPLGSLVAVDSTSKFTVKSYKLGGNDLGPYLQTTVRGEAAGAAGHLPTDVSIICSNSTEEGGYQADSTVTLQQAIPGGAFAEGVLNLLIPGDGRYGKPVPHCATPAVVVAKASSSAAPVSFAIPDELIGELNAAADRFNAAHPASTSA